MRQVNLVFSHFLDLSKNAMGKKETRFENPVPGITVLMAVFSGRKQKSGRAGAVLNFFI